MARVLVLDDKEMMRDSLQATLTRAGHEVTTFERGAEALNTIQKQPFDVIVSDLKMPKMDGLTFLEELRKITTEIPVVMMTAYATISTAVDAMRKGAFDYIQKPFDADEIQLLIERALEHSHLIKENEAYRASERDWRQGREFIGKSNAIKKVMDKIALVAQSSATVLIRGDSGTGKEMIAREIHAQSPRADQPLLCVNCAALSNSLLESELFGHEKGAFTGADQVRMGRFELADGGTILLDEISEMNLQLQAKFLRVLQEREFERVGSSITRQVNVRVVATTNRDLESWVREGKFREDLYYRLNVVPIIVPSLSERLEDDLEMLCEYFLERSVEREGRPVRRLSQAAIELLKQYHWPGNIRELENLMERVSILASSEVITPDMIRGWLDVTSLKQNNTEKETEKQVVTVTASNMRLVDVERELIEKTLQKFNGHRQKTAEALGIGVRTLGMKLKQWNLQQAS